MESVLNEYQIDYIRVSASFFPDPINKPNFKTTLQMKLPIDLLSVDAQAELYEILTPKMEGCFDMAFVGPEITD